MKRLFIEDPKPFQLQFNCNNDNDYPKYVVEDNGLNVISPDGCGKLNLAAYYYFKYRPLNIFFIFAMGLILGLFGGSNINKISNYVKVMTGIFISLYFNFYIIFIYFQKNSSILMELTFVISAIVFFYFLFYFSKKSDKFFFLTLASFISVIFCKFLFTTIPNFPKMNWIITVIIFGPILFAIIIFLFFCNNLLMIIYISSLSGSFFFCYSIGLFLKLSPNLTNFNDKFKTDEKINIVTNFIFFVFFLSVMSIFYKIQIFINLKNVLQLEEKRNNIETLI